MTAIEARIGIVGVGLMGHGIASSVQRAGCRLGFMDHPLNQPVDDLLAGGARKYSSPAEVAANSDIILLVVTGAPQVEEVVTGPDGLLKGLLPGATVIDCSTSLPATSRRISELVSAAGGHFLDAPMTRTPKEAAEGRLNLIVGGDRDVFEKALPLLRTFAENIVFAGGAGAGHTLKLLHNYVSLGFANVLAEAAACAHRSGVDANVFLDVLSQGGGAGVVLQRQAPYIRDKDTSSFRFSIANAEKDIGYYLMMSRELSSPCATAEAVHESYRSAVENGHRNASVPEMIGILSGTRD